MYILYTHMMTHTQKWKQKGQPTFKASEKAASQPLLWTISHVVSTVKST